MEDHHHPVPHSQSLSSTLLELTQRGHKMEALPYLATSTTTGLRARFSWHIYFNFSEMQLWSIIRTKITTHFHLCHFMHTYKTTASSCSKQIMQKCCSSVPLHVEEVIMIWWLSSNCEHLWSDRVPPPLFWTSHWPAPLPQEWPAQNQQVKLLSSFPGLSQTPCFCASCSTQWFSETQCALEPGYTTAWEQGYKLIVPNASHFISSYGLRAYHVLVYSSSYVGWYQPGCVLQEVLVW